MVNSAGQRADEGCNPSISQFKLNEGMSRCTLRLGRGHAHPVVRGGARPSKTRNKPMTTPRRPI